MKNDEENLYGEKYMLEYVPVERRDLAEMMLDKVRVDDLRDYYGIDRETLDNLMASGKRLKIVEI